MTLPITLHVNGQKVETIALVDSGAAGIFIDRFFAEQNGLKMDSLPKKIEVFNVDGTENQDGSITKKVSANLDVKGRKMKTQFLVTALGSQRVILGYPWLVYANPKINWKKREFSWWESIPKVNIYEIIMKIQDKIENDLHEIDDDLTIAFLRGPDKSYGITNDWVRECLNPQDTSLNINSAPITDQWVQDKMTQSQYFATQRAQERQKLSVEDLVPKEFHDFIPTVFSERPIGKLPTSKKYDHAIDLKPDFIPKIQKPFRLNPKEEQAVTEFIEENLRKGFIRVLKSEQASALFFVPKTGGDLRPVQDYPHLNQGTVKNAYPLPRIDDLIDGLYEYDLFLKFDVRWGYNNVLIKDGDHWKAAFICKQGLFEPLVMYFGLTNSPATFQSMMDKIFKGEIAQGWLKIYMDDLLICGKKSNRAELVERGRRILQILMENDLFVKPDKCFFFVEKVEFLGFVIHNGRIEMDQMKLDGIAKWPPPRTLKQLRSFLGFCNFYRRFITHYADKTAPLNVLLRKTHPWEWTSIHHAAFETMKVAFASQPVLLMPNYSKPFEIESDASLYATGAVLLQQDTNGEWHPVAFHSQSMSPTEWNYQVYDRELMAIIHALRNWRCYIYGSPFTTIVWTDHHNLTFFTHPQKLTRRQVPWVVELMEYDLKLQHKKGSKMVVADALSRRADWSTGLEHDNEDVVALPESLWIRLVDMELQDAVAAAQKEDTLVWDAVSKLSDPLVSPQCWTIETSRPDSSTRLLFYNGRLYIPDNLDL